MSEPLDVRPAEYDKIESCGMHNVAPALLGVLVIAMLLILGL